MSRRGRPRQRTEVEELRASSKVERKDLAKKFRELRKETNRFEYAWEAATVLHTLQESRLSPAVRAVCDDRVKRLRRTNVGRKFDPYGSLSDPEFLETFIEAFEPGWDWRKQAEDWSQAGERVARNDRYIREMAQILRNSKAQAKRHVVPDAPDPARLIYLANRIKLNDRTTWPTLKELKLTTGQSERTIRQIIKNLRPKKSELVLKTPKRFGPRLVLRILEKSLNLCSTGMDEKTRSNCMVSLQRLQQVVAIRS